MNSITEISFSEGGSGYAPRSQATRLLHVALLLAVVHQLINSQFISRPVPGEGVTWTFWLHEYVGLASLMVVGAFWIWSLVRSGETRLGALVPWFSATRRGAVFSDLAAQLRRLARFHAPDDGDGALASSVHGLGLLVVTAMAATGTFYFFAEGTPAAHTVLSVHKLLANFTWAYLVAHAGLAVLHRLLGSDILSRMFWVGRRGGVGRGRC